MTVRRLASLAAKGEHRPAGRLDPMGPRMPTKKRRILLCVLMAVTMALLYFLWPFLSPFLASVSGVSSTGGMPLTTATVTPDEHAFRRVAICFFGLTRSLNHTIDSIKENLIGPILKQGFEVDVFVHTYNDVRHLTNTRTGEDSDLDADQWKLLSPFDVSLTSQDEFLEMVECGSPSHSHSCWN